MDFSSGSLGPWVGLISRRVPWGLGLDGFAEGFPGALSWTSESLSLAKCSLSRIVLEVSPHKSNMLAGRTGLERSRGQTAYGCLSKLSGQALAQTRATSQALEQSRASDKAWAPRQVQSRARGLVFLWALLRTLY